MALTYKDLTKQQFIVLTALCQSPGCDVDGVEDVEFIREFARRYEGCFIIGPAMHQKFPYPRVGVAVTPKGRQLQSDYENDLKDRIQEEKHRRAKAGEQPLSNIDDALIVIQDKE